MPFDKTITIVSCIFSMAGSLLVGATSLFPIQNRKKMGKVLLLWLSVSDFFTPLIYIIQCFYESADDSDFCKTFALLGIFFPVASFLWTDVIAYYLYSVVATRTPISETEQRTMLKFFHLMVWGTSLFVILLIGLTGNAGRQGANGPKWCWIKKSSTSIYWELVGGKLVEWTSCLFIMPYFYISAAVSLRKIDQNRNVSDDASSVSDSKRLSVDSKMQSVATNRSDQRSEKFSRFYLKMASIPIVFFIIRFWGNLRILLSFAQSSEAQNSTLADMQYFFDPSQGFFNAILFVLSSADGQRSVVFGFSFVCENYLFFIPGSLRCARSLKEQWMPPTVKIYYSNTNSGRSINSEGLKQRLLSNKSLSNGSSFFAESEYSVGDRAVGESEYDYDEGDSGIGSGNGSGSGSGTGIGGLGPALPQILENPL